MSRKQRFMLQICQFLTSIMSQSLKILRADPSCFGKSWRTPHAPGLMHTPQLCLSPWQCHHHHTSSAGASSSSTAQRWPLLTFTFSHCSSRLDLNRCKLEIKRFNIPPPILWATNLQNHFFSARKSEARSGTTGRQLLAIVPGAAIISDNIHAQGTATEGCKILKGTSIVKWVYLLLLLFFFYIYIF